MKRLLAALCLLVLVCAPALAQSPTYKNEVQNMNNQNLPHRLYGGIWLKPAGHLQGIACDENRDYMYMSFTDRLVKVDMHTNKVVASVTGLLAGGIYGGGAHLGCLAYYQGKVYGSLEYKAAEKFYVAVSQEQSCIGRLNLRRQIQIASDKANPQDPCKRRAENFPGVVKHGVLFHKE